MSHLLWKYYWENDVERFHRFLEASGASNHGVDLGLSPKNSGTGNSPPTSTSHSSYPRVIPDHRFHKASSPARVTSSAAGTGRNGAVLGRAEVNSRDHAGLTVLLRAAGSTAKSAVLFVQALLEHPTTDIHVQDLESGWNALHRSLYAGNITIARLLLEKERMDLTGMSLSSPIVKSPLLIKTKDHEGKSPFDLYNTTIEAQPLHGASGPETGPDSGLEDDDAYSSSTSQSCTASITTATPATTPHAIGDEVYVFGSNKNLSLGVGDQDDRQYPERIDLRRPKRLLLRLANTMDDGHASSINPVVGAAAIPTMIRNQPLRVEDVVMSKYHSAVITSDPVCNLYVSGIGRGGRLGLGDENTQFRYVPVLGPFTEKRVSKVSLGQNHSMAIVDGGELWTWGLNSDAQLGYMLPPPSKGDADPMCLSPRQLFATLKRERIQGIAASVHHSVAHTGTSLYCWGRNLGQLGLMDSDSRSLETQATPRKVAASLFPAPIVMVSAIEKATTCLLANHAVCVFANYGYNFVKFPLPDPRDMYRLVTSRSHRYDPERNPMSQIASGGETIVALTKAGHLFAMTLNNRVDSGLSVTSTTNPAKIRSAVTNPQHVWNSRKERVTSVGVGDHGSVIICTESGAAWRRVERSKATDTTTARTSGPRQKNYKFQRVPAISNVVTVRSSAFGAFAAICKDCDVMRTDVDIGPMTLRDDVAALLSIREFKASSLLSIREGKQDESGIRADSRPQGLAPFAFEVMRSADVEADMTGFLETVRFQRQDFDAEVCVSAAPEIRIPVHSWLLGGRSPVFRKAMAEFLVFGALSVADTFSIHGSPPNRPLVTFDNLDLISLLNVLAFVHLDVAIPVWEHARRVPAMTYRYRQVRVELMKLAVKLAMPRLETAVRLQTAVSESLADDMLLAAKDVVFFHNADAIVELNGGEARIHSRLVARRCPFFETLFFGRSRGFWIANRQSQSSPLRIDLRHVNPTTFNFVLLHLYGDTGPEMFDSVMSETLGDLLDLIMDVMSVANELMLERLTQICQNVMGHFVTTRNVATLLNAISPCAMTGFKRAGLRYICLQMETLLENHQLRGLDPDLMAELEDVVRARQSVSFPSSIGGQLALDLHAKNPNLSSEIDEERQRRVRDLLFRARMREENRKSHSSVRFPAGSAGETRTPTPAAPAKGSNTFTTADLAERFVDKFMKEVDIVSCTDQQHEQQSHTNASSALNFTDTPSRWLFGDTLGKKGTGSFPLLNRNNTCRVENQQESIGFSSMTSRQESPVSTSSRGVFLTSQAASISKTSSRPWNFADSTGAKAGLYDIMSEASASEGLAHHVSEPLEKGGVAPRESKMSQRERKRQQQETARGSSLDRKSVNSSEATRAWEGQSRPSPNATPWKKTPASSSLTGSASLISTSATVSDFPTRPAPRQVGGSSDTRFSGQKPHTAALTNRPSRGNLTPHSKTYTKPSPKAEPVFGIRMADIIVQQQHELDVAREAVAKRSLQDIQQEQAFQEWWDQESRRMQEEEEATKKAGAGTKESGGGSNTGRRKGWGRRNRGKGEASTPSSSSSTSNVAKSDKKDRW